MFGVRFQSNAEHRTSNAERHSGATILYAGSCRRGDRRAGTTLRTGSWHPDTEKKLLHALAKLPHVVSKLSHARVNLPHAFAKLHHDLRRLRHGVTKPFGTLRKHSQLLRKLRRYLKKLHHGVRSDADEGISGAWVHRTRDSAEQTDVPRGGAVLRVTKGLSMATSFFITNTDSLLAARSAHFSAMISAQPERYGIDPQRAAEYAALNDAFRQAYDATSNPGMRTPGLVLAKNSVRASLRQMASSLAKVIAAMPGLSDQEKLDVGISVRAKRTPMGPPGTPTDCAISLSTIGTLTLAWRCANPKGSSGTVYRISRQLGGSGAFAHLAVAGTKSYVDATIPIGSSLVTYEIQAIRGQTVGAPAQFNVSFGGVNAKFANDTATRWAA